MINHPFGGTPFMETSRFLDELDVPAGTSLMVGTCWDGPFIFLGGVLPVVEFLEGLVFLVVLC